MCSLSFHYVEVLKINVILKTKTKYKLEKIVGTLKIRYQFLDGA